jgi:nucleoside-diphosphate-sugar epimerase
MEWSGHPCLVTGGAGFGGSHLIEQLLDRNARVVVLDIEQRCHSYWAVARLAERVTFVQADVRDSERVRSVLSAHGIRLIFHLAAQPLIPLGNMLPWETLSVNALGTWVVLEAVRALDPSIGVVFASSGAYYGSCQSDTPIPETAAPAALSNIYSASKVAADASVLAYARTYGLRATVCRFMNTYGPGDLNFSRIIPRAAAHLILGRPFEFGDREDGANRLSYLHVRDMAAAYVAAAEGLEAMAGEAFNFGTTELVATRDIVTLVSRAFDHEERVGRFDGPHRGTAKRLDVTKAHRMLNWRPAMALEPGIQETVAWYRDHWSPAWTNL